MKYNMITTIDQTKKLYRYIPFRRFKEMLETGCIAASNPARWPDEYELFWLMNLSTEEGIEALSERMKEGVAEKDIEKVNASVLHLCKMIYQSEFAICFSENEDAEVLWRAYSDNTSSTIMLSSDVGRIARLGMDNKENGDWSINKVCYDLTGNDFNEFLNRITIVPGKISIFNPRDFFLHKRSDFAYEQEYRMLIEPQEFSDIPKERIYLRINDLSEFITGVMVHPLAEDSLVQEVRQLCDKYELVFQGKSEIYKYKPSWPIKRK